MEKVTRNILIVCTCLIIFLLGIYFYNFHNGFAKKTDDWAAFSAYVSSIAAVITFGSVVLLYDTIVKQINNAKSQDAKLEKQEKLIRYQQFETTFFNLLNNQREILNLVKILDDSGVIAFEKIANKLEDKLFRKFTVEKRISLGDRELTIDLANKQEVKEAIQDSFKVFYKDNALNIGHYLRHLYQLCSFIDLSSIDDNDKKTYFDFIQSQLSEAELYILLYNCISSYGHETFLPIADKYKIFENIQSRGSVFDKHKEMFFPNTKFKNYNTEKLFTHNPQAWIYAG